MIIAQKCKLLVPARVRPFIKKHFPRLVTRVAFALDSIPYALNIRRWIKLWSSGPSHHPLTLKMWAGFGEQAVKDLERQKLSTPLSRRTLASTTWCLAQWYGSQGDYVKAFDNLILMTTAIRRLRRRIDIQLMMVECMLQLGRPEQAKQLLEYASIKVRNPKAEFYFSWANIYHALAGGEEHDGASDAKRLQWINKVYESAGFSRIEKLDERAPLRLDNLSVKNPRSANASVKLSVLMPAYNCADTLPIALTSVLNQTWHNLEVIIVDDCSSDETWSVIEDFARRDSRIVPLRHERNSGAYTARNTALAHASGEFVTVHDADDWSHPEKFAAQMLHALAHPHGISTTSGVRLYQDLRFISRDLRFGTKLSTGGMITENTSSLLLKTQTLVDLGGWDRTRVAADSELYERIKAKYSLSTNRLFPNVPLTFVLLSGSSLTQKTATGLTTLQYGARRQYKEAYRFWHATELARANPDFRMTDDRRFPAPRVILKRNEPITDIDVIVAGNLADSERSFQQDIDQWKFLSSAGLKLGVVHWPAYEQAENNIVPEVRSAIAAGLIEIVVPGQMVRCKIAVALNSQLLSNIPSPLPEINAGHLYVVAEDSFSDHNKEIWMRCFGSVPTAIAGDYGSALLDVRQRKSA